MGNYKEDFFVVCTPDGYGSFREALEDLYVNQRKSLETIADYIGISSMTIRKKMREYGIPTRPRGTNQHRKKEKGNED